MDRGQTVRAGRALEAVPDQEDAADACQPDQEPPCSPVDIVQPPGADREARQECAQFENAVERRSAGMKPKIAASSIVVTRAPITENKTQYQYSDLGARPENVT